MITTTISIYVGSKTTARAKIEAIEALIDTMMLRITEVAEGTASTVDEYSMDDGQIKVRTKYRSIRDVEAGINALIKLKQYYINKYNGRTMVLRDVRGLS
tara:strand:+ start:741 stop:1040 length:300 start_codon:yes stop_codon:yes gene_type:complete